MCNIKSADAATKDPIMAFNLVFQFLFFDLRYSTRVRNWFYRKITHEMDELVAKTSVSKFFEKFAVHISIYCLYQLDNVGIGLCIILNILLCLFR